MHDKRFKRSGSYDLPRPIDTRPGEAWRPIPTLEGRYEASTHGRIRWVGPHMGRTHPGRIVPGWPNRDGYLGVRPYPSPDKRTVRVHQLVDWTFLGLPPEGMEINHKDGDRQNNRPDNLEYATHLENVRHAWRLGNVDRVGEANGRAKLTVGDVRDIRRRAAQGESQYRLAEAYGVGQSAISSIVRRKAWASVP